MTKHGQYFTYYKLTCFVLLLCMIGCAPVISKQVREQVNPQVTPEDVLKNPDQYRGEMVIISGEIVETENAKEGTLLKVLQLPAGFRGKPKDVSKSEGRFLAIVDHYLDPFIYRKGRKVTIAGRVEGTRQLPLGEILYNYPVIRVVELYLWDVERSYYSPYPSFHIGFGLGYFF